mmetsp:Transcript_42237/g.82895  ORF Transcript_42237/g.82895 Transcript_42237/m.82895 type:complete len:567 (-) Transcript_42237:593-2293(-)
MSGILHGERPLPLRGAPNIRGVPEHLVERHLRNNHGVPPVLRHPRRLNQPHPPVEPGDDGPLKLLRPHHLHLHDGLQDAGARLPHGLPDGACHTEAEGHVGGVHLVRGPVEQDHAHRLSLRPDEGALLHGVDDALAAAGEVLRGDVGADDAVVEFVGGAAFFDFLFRHGLDVADDLGVLSGAAGLFLVGEVELSFFVDGLFVADGGSSDGALHLVLPSEAFDVDLEMQFAHAGDDGLLGGGVEFDAEGGILLGKFPEALAEVVLVLAPARGRDGEAHDGLGHEHAAHDQVVFVGGTTEGVHGFALHPEERHDVPGGGGVDVLHLGGVHPDDARHLDLFAGADVPDGGAARQGPLVDAHVGDLAELRLLELERERHEVPCGRALERHRLLVFVHVQRHVRALVRRGEIVEDPVQQPLHALVFIGGAQEHRHKLTGQRLPADGRPDLRRRGILLHDKSLGHRLVHVRQPLDELPPELRHLCLHRRRHGHRHHLLPALPLEDVPHVFYDIHHAHVLPLQPDRRLHRRRVQRELRPELPQHFVGIGPRPIQLVHERHPRHPVPLHLTVHR